MTNRRAKAVASATVLGLGTLGGAAMATNQGLPAQVAEGGGAKTASIVTGASGTGATTSQSVAPNEGATTRQPIVTRASGGAGRGGLVPIDD
jgi:hypothetical protein